MTILPPRGRHALRGQWRRDVLDVARIVRSKCSTTRAAIVLVTAIVVADLCLIAGGVR
jgi:hypothetical protein